MDIYSAPAVGIVPAGRPEVVCILFEHRFDLSRGQPGVRLEQQCGRGGDMRGGHRCSHGADVAGPVNDKVLIPALVGDLIETVQRVVRHLGAVGGDYFREVLSAELIAARRDEVELCSAVGVRCDVIDLVNGADGDDL